MKNKLNRLNIITAAIIAAVLFGSLAIGFFAFGSIDFNRYDNRARVMISPQKADIQKGVYKRGTYPYMVVDLSGRVLYAQAPFTYKAGDTVNVQEILQYDKSFAQANSDKVKESFVLEKDGAVSGFAVFLVPRAEVYHTGGNQAARIFVPVLLGMLISAAVIVLKAVYCKRRIFTPIKEISASAKQIIKGDYNLEVIRTYWRTIDDTEVGELIYAFELMRDELKAKQVREESLKKSQQELISCISHDLKTPISTIKAYSEGLRDHIAKSPEKQDEYARIIITKTDLLTGMISELLEYSNAQLNQLEINRAETYFSAFFDPLMAEIEVYVRHCGMDFSYVRHMPDMLVTIDKKRIAEVIYNLVDNSIKYIGDKRGSIQIGAQYEKDHMLIKVKDNGAGISPDDLPYVFDRFYRAEKSRSTSIPGSGLGLSICKYIIEKHGGEIYCKSGNNTGCEIGFTLF